MTEAGEGVEERADKSSSDLLALATAALLLVGFTFSDDIVEFLLDITGNSHIVGTQRQWLIMGLDLLLVFGTAALKWRLSDDRVDLTAFMRRLFRGWWALGALLVVGGHLALIMTAEPRGRLGSVGSFWISVLASTVFVAAMTLLLLSALAEKSASRSWIAPLVFGAFSVQVASALWYPVIEVGGGCAGNVSPGFFSDMTEMLAVLLLAVAFESGWVRRSANRTDPGPRVAPVFMVLLLCLALLLAFSMGVKADDAPCGIGAVWHEYISFVTVTQALATGLATLVWLMLVGATSRD